MLSLTELVMWILKSQDTHTMYSEYYAAQFQLGLESGGAERLDDKRIEYVPSLKQEYWPSEPAVERACSHVCVE